jgi:hypothetical protein
LEAVVDSVVAAAALLQDLPVFESGDHVLDAGCDSPVVCVVADDTARLVAPWCGDGPDVAIVAVAEHHVRAVSRCTTVWRATTMSLRVPGELGPTATKWRARALMMIWVVMLAPVFLLTAVVD